MIFRRLFWVLGAMAMIAILWALWPSRHQPLTERASASAPHRLTKIFKSMPPAVSPLTETKELQTEAGESNADVEDEARIAALRRQQESDPDSEKMRLPASAPDLWKQFSVPFGNISPKGNRKCLPLIHGWFVDGDYPGDPLVDYTFGKVAEAAFLKSVVEKPTPHAQLNHCLDPQVTRGKKIHLSAQVKFSDISDYANFHLRALDENHRMATDKKHRFQGTQDWKRFDLEADVPEEAETVLYGLTLESPGELWIKEVSLRIE